MRGQVVIIAILLQLILTIGLGLLLKRKITKGAESYLYADRSLPLYVVVPSYAIAWIGALNTIGYFEMGSMLGMQTMYHMICTGLGLVLGAFITGPWFRRVNSNSIPEIFEKAFGLAYRLLISCVLFGLIWGIITLEAQGGGLMLAGLTGIPPIYCIVIMLIIGFLYVYFAGMYEAAYLNLINYIILLIAGVLLVIFFGREVPGGWAAVGETYRGEMSWFLSAWAIPWQIRDIAIGFSIGIAIASICGTTMPLNLVSALAAKDEKTIRKTGLFAYFVHNIACFPWLIAGIAATTLPLFKELGPKLTAITFAMTQFPPLVSAIIFVAGFGAIFSTFAMCTLGCAQIFTNDIYARLINPNASGKQLIKVARLTMLGIVVSVFIPSTIMPAMTVAGYWLWPWFLPPFFALVSGLFWKRASVAWLGTTLVVYLLNSIWTFTPIPTALGIPGYIHTVYVSLVVSVVLGGIWTALAKAPAGYFLSPRDAIPTTASTERGV